MEQDKFNNPQQVGGADIANLLNNTNFISQKNKQPRLTFSLNNIVKINSSEILKLEFSNKKIIRLMKSLDGLTPVISFDIVDDEKKEIIIKSETLFSGGIGIAELLFKCKFITQWEIPIFTKICRCFLFGDIDEFRKIIERYNMRINQDSWWYLKTELGLQ